LHTYVKILFSQRQPVTVKAQFFAVGASALVEVFICAWPADYLLSTVRHNNHIKQKNILLQN